MVKLLKYDKKDIPVNKTFATSLGEKESNEIYKYTKVYKVIKTLFTTLIYWWHKPGKPHTRVTQ